MIRIEKNTEIISFLNEVWHDPIKETPKVNGALCIVCDGFDENGKDIYEIFRWDKEMQAFDTGVGQYLDEDLKDKHVWICPDGCTRWCYLEDLLPGMKYLKPYNREDPEKLEKRFWLRMELYKMHYAWHRDGMEEVFQWIYNAPLKDWGNMTECLRQAILVDDDKLEGTPLERGKQLFGFLS